MTFVSYKQPRQSRKPVFNSILNEFFQTGFQDFVNPKAFTATSPRVNIVETKEAHLLEFSVPGFEKDNFSIDIDGDQLTVSGELGEKEENNDKSYARKEFAYSNFKRTFTLPETVDKEGIQAKYEQGILNVILPKKEEAKEQPPRKVLVA